MSGGLTFSGIWSFSGGTSSMGQIRIRKMKKLTKLHVSTFAESGSVLVIYAYLGPMTADRTILTDWPPQ